MGLFARLGLGFALLFKVLLDATLASKINALLQGASSPVEPESKTPEPATEPSPPKEIAALQLLAALQREGRFIDFVKEDVQGISDEDIGGAARLVHEGCRKVVNKWFSISPVWPGEEGAPVTIEAGFDAKRIRLTGNVTGEPPFTGTLAHPGWAVSDTQLPKLTRGADTSVIAQAEVEL